MAALISQLNMLFAPLFLGQKKINVLFPEMSKYVQIFFRVKYSDGDKDVYCVCMHGLLVDMHGNVKLNVYRVHIKIKQYASTWIKLSAKYL